ncbi:MAG: flagellar hook-basal body complex protein FliE [Acidobacteriota bacterium]|jgi:flagellar hook-basal body complex protein FliE|nr:flagellar hook-basal body complex protein FliE [Acidobacteriota bacterium]
MEQVYIGPINPNLKVPEVRTPQSSGDKNGTGFGDILKDAISTVNELQKSSDQEIQKLMTGESQDLHTTVIAMQKADLSFQMMMQVRNKIVQAYQEIMRMQI